MKLNDLFRIGVTCVCLFQIAGCQVGGGYAKDYVNRLDEFVDVREMKLDLPVDPEKHRGDSFYIWTQYQDATKQRVISIDVIALGLNSELSGELQAKQLLKEKRKRTIIKFIKLPGVKNDWSATIIGHSDTKWFFDLKRPWTPKWNLKMLNAAQKKITGTETSKACYHATVEPTVTATELWADGLYSGTPPGFRNQHAGASYAFMNPIALRSLSEFLILPAGIIQTKESRIDSSFVNKSGKFIALDESARDGVARLLQKYIGKVSITSNGVNPQYEALYKEYTGLVGKVSLSQLWNPYKGEHPSTIFRKQYAKEVDGSNQGLVSLEITRYKSADVRPNENDLLYFSFSIYDARQEPKRNFNSGNGLGAAIFGNKNSGKDDVAAFWLSTSYSIPQEESAKSYYAKNKKFVLERLENAVQCYFERNEIERKHYKSNKLDKYDGLGASF